MEQTGSKLGKEYVKAVYCHLAYLTYAEYIIQNAELDEAQAGIKVSGRNINNFRYANDTKSGLISQGGESLMGFLELRKEPGVYSRVTAPMSIVFSLKSGTCLGMRDNSGM